MDTLRGHEAANDPDEMDYAADSGVEAPPEIGSDERRMHVRAYNHWASLLGDRELPSIADLNPGEIEDFGPHSVLLDFTGGLDDPRIVYLGSALRRECEIEGDVQTVADVPARSLLSRLTDHYLQIIANAAPIGFEAEFVNQRGVEIMYRGILMPFSSNEDSIDFVYGVINWKEVACRDLTDALAQEVDQALRSAPVPAGVVPVWADGPSHAVPMDKSGDPADPDSDGVEALDADAALSDRLAAARDCARLAGHSEARSRQALYRAIGLSYDFALAARVATAEFDELLEDAGIKVQARSPMTAVVKLIFGSSYDKTRLAEYAAVLDHAADQALELGTLRAYLEDYPGGIKGLVRDRRSARQRPPLLDRSAVARAKLKAAPPLPAESIATDADGLAVVVARRESDGSISIVAALEGEAKLARRVVDSIG